MPHPVVQVAGCGEAGNDGDDDNRGDRSSGGDGDGATAVKSSNGLHLLNPRVLTNSEDTRTGPEGHRSRAGDELGRR